MAEFNIKGWTIEDVSYVKDEFHNEEMVIVRIRKTEEPKWQAKWIKKNNGIIWWSECSNCGKRLFISSPSKYCPECGCEMFLENGDLPESDEDKDEYYD